MNFLISVVTYNSYDQLKLFLASVFRSAEKEDSAQVDIHVADNSTSPQDISFESAGNVNVTVHNFDNPGYFGAAFGVVNDVVGEKSYDYVIISNADIELSDDFFHILCNLSIPSDTSWVAGKILSEVEHRDKNPKIKQRCSLKKLRIQRLLYRYPILDLIYSNTLYKRKSMQKVEGRQEIYAGHGSFIILTSAYFDKYPVTEYPVFLFGEEIFLAERIRNAGLKVLYVPDVIVYDKEHASTGKMKKNFYYNCNFQSIDYLIKTFYE